MTPQSSPFDKTVYLFHGGGALGAYQVGVYKTLAQNGYAPDWLIGTSIGAINSAIIAGNPEEKRVEMLEKFWNIIATPMPTVPAGLNNAFYERWQHYLSAQYTATFGQPGFFLPRPFNPWLGVMSTTDQLSYYRTDELRETLKQVIDFKYLNEKHVRLSIGAAQVASGRLVYFDNTKIHMTVDHVMASGALPPGLPAVRIDDQYYWDGGVHSNTQLNLLLSENESLRYLVFMVDLFDSYGVRPVCMDDVLKRQKDIIYSSRHRQSIRVYKHVHALRHAIHSLCSKLPDNIKDDPKVKELAKLGCSAVLHLARFHYKCDLADLSSKDYDFSSPSLNKHISSGCNDVHRVLIDPPWNQPVSDEAGVVLYEFSDHATKDNQFEEYSNYYDIS